MPRELVAIREFNLDGIQESIGGSLNRIHATLRPDEGEEYRVMYGVGKVETSADVANRSVDYRIQGSSDQLPRFFAFAKTMAASSNRFFQIGTKPDADEQGSTSFLDIGTNLWVTRDYPLVLAIVTNPRAADVIWNRLTVEVWKTGKD